MFHDASERNQFITLFLELSPGILHANRVPDIVESFLSSGGGPVPNTRESILTLFNPVLEDNRTVIKRYSDNKMAFIKVLGLHFKQDSLTALGSFKTTFLSTLDNRVGKATAKWREEGMWTGSSIVFALLECFGPVATEPLLGILAREQDAHAKAIREKEAAFQKENRKGHKEEAIRSTNEEASNNAMNKWARVGAVARS